MTQSVRKIGPFFPENLKKKFEDKEFRSAYVSDFARSSIAYQVRDMREAREWSQKDLAAEAETTQSVISRLENPEYGRFSVSTLLDLARAFDVALIIKFVPFRDLFEAASDFSISAMNVASFSKADLQSPASFAKLSPVLRLAKLPPILRNEQIFGRRGQDQSFSDMLEELSDEHHQLRERPSNPAQSLGRSTSSLWLAFERNPQQHLGEIQLHQPLGH